MAAVNCGLMSLINVSSSRPKDIAYRMIKDHLSLDGNPVLNLASFVLLYLSWHFSD